ncbi:MAG: GTP 3',8-cyclase MoaA, partial [Acidobacteriota bacterium]
YSRVIDYMRLSVTDRCNLRCVYCTPLEGSKTDGSDADLTDGEIVRLVRIAADLGIRRVRLTGGEPLVRPGLARLVEAIASMGSIEDVSITTNATLLAAQARALADAGLRRVNVSLDSFQAGRYRSIRRRGHLEDVLEGIERAREAGLSPIKINMVPIRGVNDDEIEDFARFAMTSPYHVRFIELMPMGPLDFWSVERMVPTREVMERVGVVAELTPAIVPRSGPARHFRLGNSSGLVGFISPMSHRFCDSCNRIRLTCRGNLRPCLFSEKETPLAGPLRAGATDAELGRLFALSLAAKPAKHAVGSRSDVGHLKGMSKIGG